MQIHSGRPKDLEKRAKILQAAKSIFLKMGYHATNMNQIAKEAGVTKLTVYNHFQDKNNLFMCAIEESCEESIRAKQFQLTADSDFKQALVLMCQRALSIIYLPEALKLDCLLFELAAEQSPLTRQFFDASHTRMCHVWCDFFEQAISFKFIQADEPIKQTELIISLMLGIRHQQVLLGLAPVPTADEIDQMIEHAIEIFLLKYQTKV
ncbi:TetR/AcrR family transcriptional regulator [Acinetobacter courvalinii]|uniref:TetR/AcrR family transcriptional regulator n=1 Tax=Acinetobacter TaxID=469 RepID=UPI00029DFE56|nr:MULTISPECIES: TetR/AcrR family transcriptional regulator [Acinetobacter]EXB26995.1 bacterial regulatory s, tetR family protein [Acinetobacter baumannii 1437282]EXB47777.1 bacterial regulatory s, tetR family protein [Acinetobacter baumannii 146457]EKU58783.1 transcriptional regulator, TetR family [Acinetobacter sp. WC-323]EYT19825.1 bacterial regulatory s, tetR family protein [Acinetobacter sp. 1000160]MCU4391190.1 TetR/AcrR family transcriptional regulator [Acinetobacter courvalinii]